MIRDHECLFPWEIFFLCWPVRVWHESHTYIILIPASSAHFIVIRRIDSWSSAQPLRWRRCHCKDYGSFFLSLGSWCMIDRGCFWCQFNVKSNAYFTVSVSHQDVLVKTGIQGTTRLGVRKAQTHPLSLLSAVVDGIKYFAFLLCSFSLFRNKLFAFCCDNVSTLEKKLTVSCIYACDKFAWFNFQVIVF